MGINIIVIIVYVHVRVHYTTLNRDPQEYVIVVIVEVV